MRNIKNLKKRLGDLDKKLVYSLGDIIPFLRQYKGYTVESIIDSNPFYLKPMIDKRKIELDNEAYMYYISAIENALDNREYRED